MSHEVGQAPRVSPVMGIAKGLCGAMSTPTIRTADSWQPVERRLDLAARFAAWAWCECVCVALLSDATERCIGSAP